MTGRHRDHQTFALAGYYTVKGLGDTFVVFPNEHLGPDVLAEAEEVSGCTLLRFKKFEAKLQAKLFVLYVIGFYRVHRPRFEICINITPDCI
jgi:hypothetical protein